MKNRLYCFLILILLLCQNILFAQDINYAKFLISNLASPEFKGRGYVGNGVRVAAGFIKVELDSLHINPAFNDSYFQEFTVSANTFPQEITVKMDNEELKPAVDFLVESSCPPIQGKFGVKYISRKDLTSDNKLSRALLNSEVSFLLIDNSDKSGETIAQSKKTDDIINFLKYSNQISLKGVIIYSPEKLTWDASAFQNIRPVVILNKVMNLSAIHNVVISVKSKFIRKYKTQNIAAYFPGSVCPDSFIVLTAHYDHLGMFGPDIYFPGANDNASGVAMLLNLAKYYSVNKPKYTILFVALSAEELGILGARKFVEYPPIDLKKVKFMINFDLAGTGDEGIKVVNGSVYPKEYNLLKKLNDQSNLLPKVESRGKACNSDQCAFDEKGVPGFYIYTLGGIKAYHDIYDRYETLPLTEFTDYCKLMIEFIGSL